VLDRESWVERLYPPMLYIARHTPSTRWRANWRAWEAPILLVYRQSPRWMAPPDPSGQLSRELTPYDVSDMAQIVVAPRAT
jgi:hypothetical protein